MSTKRCDTFTPALAVALALGLLLPMASLQGADIFTLGTGNGNAGSTGVLVPLTARHNNAMQGFSISASFNSALLTMTGLSFDGTDTAIVAPGGIPDFVGVTVDDLAGTVVAGVIFGFSPVPPLNQIPQLPASPSDEDLIANLVFDISPSALPTTIPIDLVNGLGSPPVDNVYSNDGFSFAPQLVDGSISVNNLHRLYFDPMLGIPGGSVGAIVQYDNEDAINAFVLSFSWDSAKLTLQPAGSPAEWYQGTDLDAALGNHIIEYFDLKTVPAFPQPGVGYLAMITIFDFVGPVFAGQNLPAGNHQSLVRLNFTVANNPGLVGVTTPVRFENTISPAPPPPSPGNPNPAIPPPTANLVVTTESQGITPIQENGQVQIVDLPSFQRGNANSDSAVDVADAIFLLQFLFTGGNPPLCSDAADANDDANMSGLGIDVSDAIFLIGYLFTDGAMPPPPFPGCGLDGTQDGFPECQNSIGPCP